MPFRLFYRRATLGRLEGRPGLEVVVGLVVGLGAAAVAAAAAQARRERRRLVVGGGVEVAVVLGLLEGEEAVERVDRGQEPRRGGAWAGKERFNVAST